ncbi:MULTISPECIES: DUF4129 domain-containing protein [Croceibacter]|nr:MULTISPECIES: DUF4129 domain-containing protein [Croceibacter]MBG24806.1 DUF4129 domain-containing protein [Croceibacter sp.]
MIDDTDVNPLQINRSFIKDLKKDSDFNYVEIVEEVTWWQKIKRWLNTKWIQFMNWLFGDYEGNAILLFLVNYLPYLILVGIVGFIVWLFIKLNIGNRFLKSPDSGEVLMSEDEDIIKRQHIPSLIEDALNNKQYRLAIRYHYLFVLKQLTDAEQIDYEFDKTNTDYLNEITNKNLKNGFTNITRIYDFIWYGNFSITQKDYVKAKAQFNEIETLL